MLKSIFAALALLCAIPAQADSWDSQKNIGLAVDKARAAHQQAGVDGMVSAAQNCYAGLDLSRRSNPHVERDLEYCIALEIAAAKIDNEAAKANNAPRSHYLQITDVFMRATANLEKARIVTIPEHIQQYMMPRIALINTSMQAKQ